MAEAVAGDPTTVLVHLGDFHAGPGPRNADRFRALDQILDECVGLPRLGAWLWPGDLNHGRMTIEDRNALVERLRRMAAVAPVLLVYGNHDMVGDLDVFGRLRATWPIVVVSHPEIVPLTLATGHEASIFCLPYPTKAGLTSAGVAKDDVVATAAEALDFIFMQAAGDLQRAASTGVLTLMVGHVNVGGSQTSSGQPNVGHEIEISRAHIDRLGPIYKGLNHIHLGQTIAGAWYPGSVCRLNWGEIEPKRYLRIACQRWEEVDLRCAALPDAPAPGPGTWTHSVEACPLTVAPMYHVDGSLTREGFTWAVTAGPGGEAQTAPPSWRGCEVRCRYTFPQSDKNILLHAQVHAEFADALRLEVEPIAVADRALRSPAVAAARTLADKVAAFSQVEQLAPTLAEKLAQLEHQDGVTVLDALRRRLAGAASGDNGEAAA